MATIFFEIPSATSFYARKVCSIYPMNATYFRHLSDSRYCFAFDSSHTLLRVNVSKSCPIEEMYIIYGDRWISRAPIMSKRWKFVTRTSPSTSMRRRFVSTPFASCTFSASLRMGKQVLIKKRKHRRFGSTRINIWHKTDSPHFRLVADQISWNT